MQWIACFLLVLSFGASVVSHAQSLDTVRVRIKSNLAQVSVSGLNLRLLNRQKKFNKVVIAPSRQLQISRVAVAGKTYWQVSDGPQDVMSADESLVVQGENLHQDAMALPNRIMLKESSNGQIDLIGLVPMDEYVFSVLANEMPLTWPMETLKAQAVAIRSYTEAVLNERKDRSFHVESSVLDQVYKKIEAHQSPMLFAKARKAVEETSGVFLINKKNRVLKAFYHADCGGRTVSAASVWPNEKDNDAGTAIDTTCPLNPMAQWSYRLSKEKFASIVQNFLGDIRSNEFRQILGFMNLRSTNFEMRDREDQVEFVGKGFGHGVGMCQWGSRALGLKAFSYQRILQHYYPLASIRNLSESN